MSAYLEVRLLCEQLVSLQGSDGLLALNLPEVSVNPHIQEAGLQVCLKTFLKNKTNFKILKTS